jgi:hypothetical protein
VYSDASGTGYGGYVVNIIDNEVMGRWNSVEGIQSSTCRELEAVYRVLLSLLDILQGQKVKWYTDNQNIVHILNKGSRKNTQISAFSMAVFSFQKIISSTALLFTITGASQPALANKQSYKLLVRNRTTGLIAPCIEIICPTTDAYM